MRLTEEELTALELVLPESAQRFRDQYAEEDAEDVVEFVDSGPIVFATESGEARDMDTVQPKNICPACERGAPRAGAPHTCGKPNPYLEERYRHG